MGGSGFLGQEITRQARLAGDRVVATFHSHAPLTAGVDWRALDIRRRDKVAVLVEDIRPAVIINAAFQQADWTTAADGGVHVAAAAAARGTRLVHVSSDAVFSGRALRYDETCVPDPTTPYGAAKAAAETAIKGLDPTAIIARTSLIIGDSSSQHEAYVHALASGAKTGALFTDDVRCPVHVTDLALALLELARSPYSGIHHIADAISRHELRILIEPFRVMPVFRVDSRAGDGRAQRRLAARSRYAWSGSTGPTRSATTVRIGTGLRVCR